MNFKFRTEPFEHQRAAFERSRDRESFALFMEMGTGKSKVVVDTAAWLFGRGQITALIIICPKTIVSTWVNAEIPTHMDASILESARILEWRSGETKKNLKARDTLFQPDAISLACLVINIDAVNTTAGMMYLKKLINAHHAMVVIDESTVIKNPTAKRTKALLRLAPGVKYRRILSGRPVAQSPLDLYAQCEFLDPHILGFGSFYTFRNRYALLRKAMINGRKFDQVVGFQRLDELRELIRPHATIVHKDDCLDLPEKLYSTRYVELSKEQAQAYNELCKVAMTVLDKQSVVTAPLVITQLLRLRQVLCGFVTARDADTNLPKIVRFNDNPRLGALAELCEEASGKVIIWTTFLESIEIIAEHLSELYGKTSVLKLSGSVPAADRWAAVERFQQDPTARFFIGQVNTGGRGITLTKATTVIYYDNDWSLEVRAQSEDRAHRIGQREHVTYIDLIAKGTVDEKVVEALRRKESLSDAILAGGWQPLLALFSQPTD